jgi:hypothetical protein
MTLNAVKGGDHAWHAVVSLSISYLTAITDPLWLRIRGKGVLRWRHRRFCYCEATVWQSANAATAIHRRRGDKQQQCHADLSGNISDCAASHSSLSKPELSAQKNIFFGFDQAINFYTAFRTLVSMGQTNFAYGLTRKETDTMNPRGGNSILKLLSKYRLYMNEK